MTLNCFIYPSSQVSVYRTIGPLVILGVPKPTVAWYRHGQPLGSGEFWDVYSQDDYHFLSNSETGFLECEEIVCRVENDVGYIQSVLKLDKEGMCHQENLPVQYIEIF